jgi:hypothetical protein
VLSVNLRLLELSILVLRIHQGSFPPKKILIDFLVPHKFVSGGNLMNGISFEMASCQVFISS